MRTRNSRNQRISLSFLKELEDIQKSRKKAGFDKGLKRGISTVKITEMIPKYINWREFKHDLINHSYKRGHKRRHRR